MRVALIGCGLIGQKRATALFVHPEDQLVAAVDVQRERAEDLARAHGAAAGLDWEPAVKRSDVDAVILSTPNDSHEPIALACLKNGKHVLCEKPLGRNADECERMVAAAGSAGKVLKAGFNHRHHPALLRAHQEVSSGNLGPVLWVRGLYGHGGRPGYEREWRGDARTAGGGILLDQGIHLVDLARWFLGEVSEVQAMTARCFWPIEPLEDTSAALLRTASGQTAFLHTSWTQWKNLFSFEVALRDGYIRVQGLGGSYGKECLIIGRRKADHGPPEESQTAFEGDDRSWSDEWGEFRDAVRGGREPMGGGRDGLAAARIVDALYRSDRTGRAIRLR